VRLADHLLLLLLSGDQNDAESIGVNNLR
jgi:hypothetical protein